MLALGSKSFTCSVKGCVNPRSSFYLFVSGTSVWMGMENTRWALLFSCYQFCWFGRERGGATEGPADRYLASESVAKGSGCLSLLCSRATSSLVR